LALTGTETLAFHSYYVLPGGAWFSIELWSVLANAKVKDIFPGGSGMLPVLETEIGWPAGHPATIAVGASTDRDFRADYSQYGDSTNGGKLDFVAPAGMGWNQVTTLDTTGIGGNSIGDITATFDGTSAACPVAAGIGALVLSVNPELTAAEARSLMQQTCDRIGGVTYDANGRHPEYGYGRVNASNAVRRAMVNLAVSQTAQGPISLGNPFSYFITVTNRGPSREGAVVLSNQLPANVTFNSATFSQGSYTQEPNNLLVFSLGSLSAGTNATVQVNVTPNAAGTLVNRAGASGKAMDQNLVDNSSTITNTVAAFTNSVLVYDNTQTYLGFPHFTSNEVGDEIVLAPGSQRTAVSFSFSYVASASLIPAPQKTAVVRLYMNDGSVAFGLGRPDTLLFESQPIPLAAGSNLVELNVTNPVALPGRLTWTIKFSGLATNESAGLLAFSPPAVGSNFAHFWQKIAGVWDPYVYSDGTPADFAAVLRAIPTTPPVLSGLVASNQMFQLFLAGDPGLRTTILASTNLREWSVLTVITNPAAPPHLVQLPLADAPARFFRATTP
jgi:uncharacterized repeat protein (TIGR01451 family)